MKLVRLTVHRFQCIETAEVEFGPGLNVLYGPNDLGKSSLAWAIRAVLLLQHNSSVHERFVSWYGGGEPRVVLTISDDDGRYWRVTKSFGTGTTGRSILESSKDGRTFTAEASGRQVDDKLRTLLRWGLHRPGGQSTPRGLPMSFLTHVLLADQDDVRKILFDTSLAEDNDESGRLRLTEALGALAQDPIFKKVLDDAQEHVDRAFTPTGRKKKSAGSPFIEIAEKLKNLQQDRDELTSRVKETELAEAKILELVNERDDLVRQLDEAKHDLAKTEAAFAARQRRDALYADMEGHKDRLNSVDGLQRNIERKQEEAALLRDQLAASQTRHSTARDALAAAEKRAGEARRAFEALSSDDIASQRAARELAEHEKTAQEDQYQAQREVERAADALRNAFETSRALGECLAKQRKAAEESRLADETSTVTSAAVDRARGAVEDAKQRLRDVTSGDRAQARELSRKDLENRRLKRATHRSETERALERAGAVGVLVDKAAATRSQIDELAQLTAKARDAVAEDQKALTQLEGAVITLQQLDTYAKLKQAREELAATQLAATAAEQDRARAATLRQQAVTVRAEMRADLPTAQEIDALRKLRDELRVAEARLSAVSVTIRPKRPITIRATQDGVADAERMIEETTSLSANRALVVSIADVAEVEVTGGDADARRSAAFLRDRWQREGTPVLQKHQLETVEELADLRRADDRRLADAAALERDAEHADERATQHAPRVGDDDEASDRCAALEAALSGVDLGNLEPKLAGLGSNWAQALRQRTNDVQSQRTTRSTQAENRRTLLAKAEAQLEALGHQVETEESEAKKGQEALGEPWSRLNDRHRLELGEADRDLADIDRQLDAVCGSDTNDESSARDALKEQEALLATAQRDQRGALEAAQAARDAMTATTTQLEAARERARALDPKGIWRTSLRDGAELETKPWREDLRVTGEQLEMSKQRLADVRARVERHGQARAEVLNRAREASADAEKEAVAAREQLEELQRTDQIARETLTTTSTELGDLRVNLAGVNVEESRQAVAALRVELAKLEDSATGIDETDVQYHSDSVTRLAKHLREVQDDLTKARGALEHVGGAIVREQIRELESAIQQHKEQERAVEVEYDAWKLLVDTLRSAESTEGQHLGRQLAGPVSQRFRQLTGGRYGQLELGAHLETEGLRAAGELREVAALSAGTQDQLATLLRLCIAEQLHSAIVLDDHLSQSDPARIAWFNDILRAASQQLQVIFITCRPNELLLPAELPGDGEASRGAAAGLIKAVNMAKIIRRFASSEPGETVTPKASPQVSGTAAPTSGAR